MDPTPRYPSGDSFAAFFDEAFPLTMRVARRVTGDRGLAEELAAEACARAYARWRQLERDPRRIGWVIRVTVNLAIDNGRRRRPVVVDPGPTADRTDDVAVRLALTAALHHLPRRQRDVVCLRYLADMSESDVATALGISVGSVKTHLHRGLQRLRVDLGGSEGTNELALA